MNKIKTCGNTANLEDKEVRNEKVSETIKICNLRNGFENDAWSFKVDRSGVLGNPFTMKSGSDREKVCAEYERYFYEQIKTGGAFRDAVDGLRTAWKTYGRLNLYCWCAPKKCHAETIRNYLLKENEAGNESASDGTADEPEPEDKDVLYCYNCSAPIPDEECYEVETYYGTQYFCGDCKDEKCFYYTA
ncbi:hypothetical protein FACS1894211_16130 [Clostridia bacterium]|nr:hypothetical protein FACS1894211_16130 [Clostridia bacterium]